MGIHLNKEVEKLKKMVLALSAKVQDSVRDAVYAVQRTDKDLAQEVVKHDYDIDMDEVDIEEECLKILALHQPVAIDLRFLVAILKINNDLERIGDLASNIAKRAMFFADNYQLPVPFDFEPMIETVQKMLSKCINSLINMDVKLAEEVCLLDDVVDDFNKEMYEKITDQIQQTPANTEQLMQMMFISKDLERIGDCSTNIAEDIVYMIEGRIIRHNL